MSALKSFRRSKGLCFKCGEKWNPQHKCPQVVSLNAIEEIWKCFSDSDDLPNSSLEVDSDSDDELMAVSVQAVNGTEGAQTIRLRSHLGGQEVYMLVDSGSNHSFITEYLAVKFQPWKKLSNAVQVQVANGAKIVCTRELPNQIWGIQGQSFFTTFKILPLGSYDIILDMDWLSSLSPMEIHWDQRWLKFSYIGSAVKLQGITSCTQFGPPVSSHQLQALDRTDAILYVVQLQPVSTTDSHSNDIPRELQHILDQFQDIFSPPSELPPFRPGDHTIPLLEGTQPFNLRPYRYNTAQKDEIEAQIKDMLAKGWIQPSTSPFASPALLVKKKTGDWR
jgi:hypothetical protein